MPMLVMEEVLKNLDIQSIFRLRKVCRNLLFSIDRIIPKLPVETLKFQLPLTKKSLKSYTKHTTRSFKKRYSQYHKPRTGCKLGWKVGNIEECRQISMEDAETVLKNPKLILEELRINLRFSIANSLEYIEKKEEDLKKFYESMKSLLKNTNHILVTKRIHMEVHNLSEAVGLLKCLDPKDTRTRINFSRMEQWENSSSKTIDVWVDKIEMKKLDELKQLFVRSPKMKTFVIKSHELYGIQMQLLSKFGQFDSYNEEFEVFLPRSTWTWLRDVPGSTEKLQIVLNIGLENHMTFSKV